jgi:putative membrane protein
MQKGREDIMPKKHLVAGCILLGIAAGMTAAPAMAQSSAPVAVNAPDIEESFLQKAVRANAFEIQTSQLAAEHTTNADVKAFAQQMITDHNKAKDELTVLLKAMGITEPSGALTPEQIQEIKLMQGAQNQDFDRLYINAQNNAHVDAVALFRQFSASGSPPQVKAWAAKTLPTLEQHLAHVQKLKS